MKRWHLPSLEGSSDKRDGRVPGADAPRVPSVGRQKPRVLFSAPECRAVVIDLRCGEELGDHRVRERAVVHVVAGRVAVQAEGGAVECDAGTLVTFEPGEVHALQGLEESRLLLVLAPWTADAHDAGLPANATVAPLGGSPRTPTEVRG